MSSKAATTLGAVTNTHLGDAVEVGSSPAERISQFVTAVNDALSDADAARRVAQAGVLVRLDFTDRPVQPVFLQLDIDAPRATVDPQNRRPDAVLTLTTADLDGCLRHGEELPLRILSGEIRFQGFIRKFLRVLPVLRAAIEQRDAERRPT
ncbi:MAG: hypothetical protein JWM93_2997 [Frankiales bacterium]|nr:hypothetical protein [Frankiales bacterium]MCW3015484.1 hypothetical protein [Solirubrobacterales bacterium]